MKKYSSKPGAFSRDDGNDDYWFNQFKETVEKSSVESNRSSIYDQISSILGNTKPMYSSMDEAISDLKERTGLNAFLKVQAQIQNQPASKTVVEPQVFKIIPEMKIFIDNYVDSHPGTSIESVIHEVLKLENVKNNLPNKTDVDLDVKSYINGKIAEVKLKRTDVNEVNMNAGKFEANSDVDENDPFSFCEPNVS